MMTQSQGPRYNYSVDSRSDGEKRRQTIRNPCTRGDAGTAAAVARALSLSRGARVSERAALRCVRGEGVSVGRVLLCAVGLHSGACVWGPRQLSLSRFPESAPGAIVSAASGDAARHAGDGGVLPLAGGARRI